MTVKIDALAASAASVIAMAGTKVCITYVNPMGYKHNSLKFNCKLEKKS